MNISKKTVLAVAILAVLAVLGYLVLPPTATTKKDAIIQLTISGAGLNFTGSWGHVGTCKKNNNAYCVNVPTGDAAELIFILTGQPDWKFSKMQLVKDDEDDEDDGKKLDFESQTGFSTAMSDDFYVVIGGANIHPDTNGIINLNGLTGDGRTFELSDKNKLEQDYIYQLQVCPTEDDEDDELVCEDSDPRLENEG